MLANERACPATASRAYAGLRVRPKPSGSSESLPLAALPELAGTFPANPILLISHLVIQQVTAPMHLAYNQAHSGAISSDIVRNPGMVTI